MRSLDPEDGLIFEMERSSHHIVSMMLGWDYRDDRFMEIACEGLIADEDAVFDRLFRHYQFQGNDHKTALEAALSPSFKHAAKRSIGDVKEGSHMRSGATGQWREVFTPRQITKSKKLFGDGLDTQWHGHLGGFGAPSMNPPGF